jgi:hypothetical protein
LALGTCSCPNGWQAGSPRYPWTRRRAHEHSASAPFTAASRSRLCAARSAGTAARTSRYSTSPARSATAPPRSWNDATAANGSARFSAASQSTSSTSPGGSAHHVSLHSLADPSRTHSAGADLRARSQVQRLSARRGPSACHDVPAIRLRAGLAAVTVVRVPRRALHATAAAAPSSARACICRKTNRTEPDESRRRPAWRAKPGRRRWLALQRD